MSRFRYNRSGSPPGGSPPQRITMFSFPLSQRVQSCILSLSTKNSFIILESNVMYIYSKILFIVSYVCKNCNFTSKSILCSLMPSGGSCICLAHIPTIRKIPSASSCILPRDNCNMTNKQQRSLSFFAVGTFGCNMTFSLLLISLNV